MLQVEWEPAVVLEVRAEMVDHLYLAVGADYEVRMTAGTRPGRGSDVEYFLIDVAVGILAVPITRVHRGGG